MNYQQTAKENAALVFNEKHTNIGASPEAFYVVWFCKTLQNWKALVSTDVVNGEYYEVTYNGDKDECYVDQYSKLSNTKITRRPLEDSTPILTN